MKLVIIGFGQAGSRIADEFARLNKRARAQRGIDVAPGVFAVNTDAADLSGLSTIKTDYQHRILIGGRKTGGHGVGKINELGAEIAREDADKVVDALRNTRNFYETDGFLLIASAAGGTGSGSMPVMAQHIKERYPDKPLYALVILPFEHEEQNEERTIYNTAVCLKSINSVADAVILVDNQRYVRKDFSLKNNLSQINSMIVAPFYNLLCAGEEKRSKFVGAKTLDAGDIIQTLLGWTVLGYGESRIARFKNPFAGMGNFRAKSSETNKGIQAMDEAISELSTYVNPKDASRALYLISGPAKEINMDLVKEIGDWLKDMAPNAIIRNGDYPREMGQLNITLILSELSDVEKVRHYYNQSTGLIPLIKQRQKDVESKLQDIDDSARDIPSLLD
ncbi:MAG: tubulin/FtsZ family protein [Dehalococcoidales bacterium]|jgi:cell division GTPase FtsZ|nr:tubulin/FtsZ family protein [Dehalococcoidales bacterium]MDD4466182.1 tubulin/FtsZ family protein [Dehalococcoidales bacterium]MDD5401965.1 tubulin/FtsZ family protein [Dehalococcoidales bacterium]